MPRMRLDFIFASRALLEDRWPYWPATATSLKKKQSGADRSGGTGGASRLIAAGIERSNLTDELSDHYPVYLSWDDECQPFD
jgi:hypothetical protein